MKGNIIRSRVQWHNEGEKPIRFFCSLERLNYIEKTIKRIDNQNRIITNQKEILGEFGKFYEKLFKSNDHNLPDANLDKLFHKINNIQKLTPKDSSNLEGPLTLNKLGSALKSM